ncbi:5'-methylthioribulose-1-phosphate dehydratase [Schizosaccharomyces cryophilus OY26]|uniref:5'-methylthioribulose-1-phosphate dehydratase n=1 Tax=Schizosaccharomyces cryophilus (strain OY26 / ATCC MYA-4695 / CBS 11777 / NBRC 106824 / NRRL Y48691) TaxID=653667 RepID=S9VXM9_SCHCR|nr:5'-methylthioribulose-1-phosphate dehydratase [Schizosaccharomyces cryophilus OY26]EPY50969.1 5'-methylthioribulose-1-phosphate dehydratase [Schizosaccharomyces cryophilus OY26]
MIQQKEKDLVLELIPHFYRQGWMRFGSGNFCLRNCDQVVCAKDRIQRDMLQEGDLAQFSLSDSSKNTDVVWSKVFAYILEKRNAVACILSTSLAALGASLYNGKDFHTQSKEMIKGIPKGQPSNGYLCCFDSLKVPIIHNDTLEGIFESIKETLEEYPETNAILIRGYGAISWGSTWEKSKTQMECYDYLFELDYKIKNL